MDHLLHLKKLAPLLRECFDSVLPSGVQPDEAMFHILDYAMDVQGQQKTTHCLIADDRVYSVFQKNANDSMRRRKCTRGTRGSERLFLAPLPKIVECFLRLPLDLPK